MKKIWYKVTYKNETKNVLAKTPEGAVKGFFGRQKIPGPHKSEGGFVGVDVEPVNGCSKVVSFGGYRGRLYED